MNMAFPIVLVMRAGMQKQILKVVLKVKKMLAKNWMKNTTKL